MTENKPKSEINLRKLMQKLGLGTNAFAEKCGMSSQSMSQFLRNKSLTTNTIYRIAVALDIDPRDMFFPTDEKDDLFSNTDTKQNEEVSGINNHPAYAVHENGLFAFDDNISLCIELKRKPNVIFDPKTVISIYIQTFNKTIVCCNEIELSKLEDCESLNINLSYPSSTLLAGNYSIRADIHLPNVCFYDRQELVSFTVYDNGTELLKYQHVNFGFVKLNPAVTIGNNHFSCSSER